MATTVEMSAPYLGLTHLVNAVAEAVVRASRSSEELQNPEEMLDESTVVWDARLRALAGEGRINGHDWDTLLAYEWRDLDIERDVFFVDDLNDCEELRRHGLRFEVVEEDERDIYASIEEIYNNPTPIDWEYWILKMPALSAGEAARLMACLEPDTYRTLDEEPTDNDTRSGRKRAALMERLALREGREKDSPFNWLLWAKEQGFEVHPGYSRFANHKQAHDEAVNALRALPPEEAAFWQNAKDPGVGNGRRMVTLEFAGSRSTQHWTLPRFIEEVTERLARWRSGEYAVIEAAQVLANANPDLVAEALCEQMETAIHAGSLVLRRNGIPLSAADIPKGRLWNRYVQAVDVNEWLASVRARYRLSYPYEAAQAPKPPERRVSDEDWKQLARDRAVAFIREQRTRDLFPSQANVADHVAQAFRKEGIVGADGKPLSGATIKRHALRGISSAIGKQLSTATTRGK